LKKLRQEVKPMSENMKSEEFRISGEEVVAKIKELLHEGNVRRIILKDEKGVTLIEVPLTIGVIGVVLLPVWAAIGAIAAMAAKLTLVVERTEPKAE
jgi:Flp pilus assembly pilin Flp